MNKKNKILIGCLSLLLVLSVGYALFSETITINGTATAKGSFDIEATCINGYHEKLVEYGEVLDSNEGQAGYDNDICTVSDNIVNANVELLYPTANRTFSVIFTNEGTIPAMINPNTDITSTFKLCRTNKETSVEECVNVTDLSQAELYYSVENHGVLDSNNNYISISDSNIVKFLDSSGENLILQQDESVILTFNLLWTREATFDTNLYEFKWTLTNKYNFVQVQAN